ncbi:MAG: suppressor of fused domain protein [Clostridiales bacterium]|jgi:hypothetical protein|nr:suppressor of fused domain protein [Clostridiales bacterium]
MGIFDRIIGVFGKKDASEIYLYSEKEWDVVEGHISKRFGEYGAVLHEIVSPDIHVDIYAVKPTAERNYYTLVTMGMGARKMNIPKELRKRGLNRAEVLITMPPDWEIKNEDEKWYWPIRWLKILARLPITQDTWLGYGHTVPNFDGKPFAENTGLCCVLLTFPYHFGSEAFICKLPNGEEVRFYQIFPIYEDEMNFKLEHDAESLEKLFGENFDMVLDLSRESVVKRV